MVAVKTDKGSFYLQQKTIKVGGPFATLEPCIGGNEAYSSSKVKYNLKGTMSMRSKKNTKKS